MAEDELRVVVRKSLGDLVAEVRQKYQIRATLVETVLEPDAIVLTFSDTTKKGAPVDSGGIATPAPLDYATGRARRRRRRLRTRIRTKTKGWDVVAKFVNSRKQSCTIYRPFYDALAAADFKRRDAYSTVRRILLENGNNPKPATVEYFLRNTLEYIESHPGTETVLSRPKGG